MAGVAALAGCSGLVEDYDEDEEPDGDGGDDEAVDDVDHEQPDGDVEFVTPEDGDEVSSPVEIELDAEDFELQPAEDDEVPEDGAGHHHVLVDEDCVEPGYVIPHDDGYHHLEDGDEEIELDLEPGEYDLCAQAGDAQHNAYDMTDEITIEVADDGDENDGDDGNAGDDEA